MHLLLSYYILIIGGIDKWPERTMSANIWETIVLNRIFNSLSALLG